LSTCCFRKKDGKNKDLQKTKNKENTWNLVRRQQEEIVVQRGEQDMEREEVTVFGNYKHRAHITHTTEVTCTRHRNEQVTMKTK
jgi:hypothetical protein